MWLFLVVKRQQTTLQDWVLWKKVKFFIKKKTKIVLATQSYQSTKTINHQRKWNRKIPNIVVDVVVDVDVVHFVGCGYVVEVSYFFFRLICNQHLQLKYEQFMENH